MGKVIVFGAGLSGLGAKELLEKKGFEVYLVDDKNGISSEEGIRIINSEKIDFIVKSPGISWKVDLLQEAAKIGIEVISEIDLAYKYMNKGIKIIGITGTNGKTTTATKIYELLTAADLKVALAGNAGYSFAKLVADEIDLQYIVLELSSYQLENNPKVHPFIAGNINLTPDHLMRYENADDYYITKFNIFNNQDENDYILINADDNEFERISEVLEERAKLNVKQRKVFLSKNTVGTVFVFESKIRVMKNMNEKIDNFIYENNDRIDKIVNEKAEIIIDIDEISLKGNHNLENALFIIGTGKILNIPNEVIAQFLKTTKALEHRLENFFLKKNTLFVNDSKGTNVESTIKAI
ncbi:MAG: UDP-N-acetylmuramoyl-L-alanine--D-glutamate ligase, partial [Leptotrichiaceae bacterium]